MEITELLAFAQKNNASDIHLASGQPPLLRINGDINPLRVAPLSAEEATSLIHSVMTEAQRTTYELEMEIDFAISFGSTNRFRVNAFNTLGGPAAVFRNIPTDIMSLDDLNAPEVLKKLTYLHKGIVLVTGPTGSGKTTTLAAMLHYINQNMNKHILTIEDPIEFIHPSRKSLVNQRELGTHTKSFAHALKSALREDPDVVLVGELRDLETIQLALTAAETGHLVFATLHTSSAAKTVDRIIDVFPSEDKDVVRTMLSSSIEAIIAQTLIKKADRSGRVAAHEILIATPAVRNLIRDNKIPQLYSLIQVGSKMGMQTMKDSVFNLLDKGKITKEAARAVVNLDSELDKENNTSGIPGTF